MKKSLKKNYFYNLATQIFSLIIPILVTPYLARVLLSDGQGKYSFTASIVFYFTLIASFGFNIYSQRIISRHHDNIKQQSIDFWEILIAKAITSILSLLVYLIIVFFNVFDEKYFLLLLIQGIQIFSIIFDISFLLQGNEEFGKIAIKNIIIKLFSIVSIFIFVKKSDDLWIYTLIQSLTVLISYLSLWVHLKKMICKISLKEIHPLKHLKPSFLLFIPTIAVSIYTSLDKTLIGLITGLDAQVGNYDNAEKIVKMCVSVISSLVTVYIPRNSILYHEDKKEELKKNMEDLCSFVLLIGIPMFLGIIAVCKNMIPWYLGDSYGEENILNVIYLMMILSPIIVIIGFGSVLGGALLIPISKEKYYTLAVLSGAVTNLVLNLILIRYFAAIGAAIATVISETLVTTFMFIFSREYINFKRLLINLIKPLLAGSVMFVTCFSLTNFLSSSILNSIIIVLVGIFVYIILLIILKEKNTISILQKLLIKIKKKKN